MIAKEAGGSRELGSVEWYGECHGERGWIPYR